MLNITSSYYKSAADFWDEVRDVDWGDDVDDSRLVNEDNYKDYLVDEIEEPERLDTPEGDLPDAKEPFEESPVSRGDWIDEIPTGNVNLGIPEDTVEILYDRGSNGRTAQDLVNDGIDNVEVINFDYVNRFGQYAGKRTVEPHYTFEASSTDNLVLVSFDRDVGDIRAFIVSGSGPGGIQDNGVRYRSVNFDPKGEIMRGVY